jgi:hypothetical protein
VIGNSRSDYCGFKSRVRGIVLKDGQPELAVAQLDDDRRRPHHSISERGFTNPEQIFNDIVGEQKRCHLWL